MPYDAKGNWVSSKPSPSGPVKVRSVKRRNSLLTVILNLPKSPAEIEEIASTIKKKLGCGGSVKDTGLEIQGDKVEAVKKLLLEMGIKSQ